MGAIKIYVNGAFSSHVIIIHACLIIYGGKREIWTPETERWQIYSLLALTACIPSHIKVPPAKAVTSQGAHAGGNMTALGFF